MKRQKQIEKIRLTFFKENVGYDYIMKRTNYNKFTEFVIKAGNMVQRVKVYGNDENSLKLVK